MSTALESLRDAGPLLLLAIVLLAGSVAGALARRARLPGITGQILGGVLLGHAGFDLFSDASMAGLEPMTEVALGLIAVTVGAHLHVGRLSNAVRRLSYLVLAESTITPLLVFGACYSMGGASFELALKNTTVQQSQVKFGLPSEGGLQPGVEPNLLSWIGDQLVPSGDIFESVLGPLGGAPSGSLRLSYADDELMVWRTPTLGNHFFVLTRGEAAAWPAMDELRVRQASAKQSVVGSAAALGMLNPFFTRAAGLRK